MANRRVLVKRRKAVRNIRKITRTMQLIATARFQAAFSRAVASRPYTETLAALAANLTRGGAESGPAHPLLVEREEIKRAALVVITSGRGLCGGYNANVIRTAMQHLRSLDAASVDCDVYAVGRKGINYFRFVKQEMYVEQTDIDDKPRFEQVEPLANELINRFLIGEVDAVHVTYMRFHSASKQRPEVIKLLPIAREESDEEAAEPAAAEVQYEFSPEPLEILAELLPATARVRLFQCFTDAAVSEQVARMVAMKAATDAAGDMITTLTRQYNRARQTAITMELLDIVGGASALA